MGTVHKLHNTKPAPIQDSVFFHKSQVHVGSKLLNLGRLTPRTIWEVTAIRTFIRTSSGGYRAHRVQTPNHLSDIVVLKCLDVRMMRECTFGNLSYSAIWRLAE
jgi:hypothetical protein